MPYMKTAAIRLSFAVYRSGTICSKWDQSWRRSSNGEFQIKMPPLRNCMECFQKDSKIGFQFLPSDKLSPVANYSHCQLTLEPAPLSAPARVILPNLLLPVMSTTLMKTDRKALWLHTDWAKYHCVIDTGFSRVYILCYRDTLNVWLWCIIASTNVRGKCWFFLYVQVFNCKLTNYCFFIVRGLTGPL